MTQDLAMPVSNHLCPTVRDDDGLALSSRNSYLNAEQRSRGLALHKALRQACVMVEQQGEIDPGAVEAAMHRTLAAHDEQLLHVEPPLFPRTGCASRVLARPRRSS